MATVKRSIEMDFLRVRVNRPDGAGCVSRPLVAGRTGPHAEIKICRTVGPSRGRATHGYSLRDRLAPKETDIGDSRRPTGEVCETANRGGYNTADADRPKDWVESPNKPLMRRVKDIKSRLLQGIASTNFPCGTGVENGKPAQGQRRPFSGQRPERTGEAVESFASELLHAAWKNFRQRHEARAAGLANDGIQMPPPSRPAIIRPAETLHQNETRCLPVHPRFSGRRINTLGNACLRLTSNRPQLF